MILQKEEILVTEPTHYFIHRIMSTSSYNQEDLLSGYINLSAEQVEKSEMKKIGSVSKSVVKQVYRIRSFSLLILFSRLCLKFSLTMPVLFLVTKPPHIFQTLILWGKCLESDSG